MSRIEEYLDHIIDPTSPAPASPGSRIETQIAQIIEQGGSGYTKAETDALLAAKADLGKLTIGGVEYTLRVSTTDAGEAGYITFVTEA